MNIERLETRNLFSTVAVTIPVQPAPNGAPSQIDVPQLDPTKGTLTAVSVQYVPAGGQKISASGNDATYSGSVAFGVSLSGLGGSALATSVQRWSYVFDAADSRSNTFAPPSVAYGVADVAAMQGTGSVPFALSITETLAGTQTVGANGELHTANSRDFSGDTVIVTETYTPVLTTVAAFESHGKRGHVARVADILG